MARKKFTKAEKKQIRKEQRQKDALRSYRFRPLKNFLFWLTGVLSSFVILITALVVGLKFVPISVYTGGNNGEVFSKDITSKSIIDAFMKYDTYDMSDFPIITNSIKDLAESEDVKKFVKIDTSKLSSLKFDANFSTELASCVEVTATLDSMGGAEILRDLGNLDIFKKWDIVPFDEMPDVDADGNMVKVEGKLINNPHLYYYKTFANEYFRAFNDNGNREQGAIDSDLYYPNLASIPLLEIMNVITDSFGRLSLNSLLTTFGAGDSFGDSFLGDILDGKTISDLENISGENILLVDILGDYNDDTKSMYDILCSIVKTEGEKPTYETLSVAHLQGGLDFDNVSLQEFLGEYEKNKEMYDLLASIIIVEKGQTRPKGYELTVGDLANGLNFANVVIVDILSGENETPEQQYQNNKTLYDVLCSAVGLGAGEQNYAKLTISHLQDGLSFDNVKLADILRQEDETLLEHYENNKMLYDVLCSAVVDGPDSWQDLTVEHLQGGLAFTAVSLAVLNLDSDTLDILLKAVNASREEGEPALSKEDLTIEHINSDVFTYITLTDVLPFEGGENGNGQLYTIFLQASDVQITDPTNESEIEEKSQKLNINNLKNFDIDLVNLSTILPVSDNQNLYKILVDATGVQSEQIKVGDFSSFKLSEIHLKTFLTGTSDNKIMKALIDSNCTVGAIGTKINELKLYDIYGSSCFVQHDQNVNTPKYKLNEETGTYTLSDDGTYMISKKAGIWLFLCFDGGEIEDGSEYSNAIGCRKTYTVSNSTMGQLQDPESGGNISTKITSATIRQLVDAGILTSANEIFYTYSLTGLANLQFETGGFISGISH